jgi:predicted choloylglycine hydrolase
MYDEETGLTGITDATNLGEAVEAGKLSPEMAAAIEERWEKIQRRCVLVTDQQGAYQIHPNADPELWFNVQTFADSVEHLEPLVGWGNWTAAYRVTMPTGETKTYFVEGPSDGND